MKHNIIDFDKCQLKNFHSNEISYNLKHVKRGFMSNNLVLNSQNV